MNQIKVLVFAENQTCFKLFRDILVDIFLKHGINPNKTWFQINRVYEPVQLMGIDFSKKEYQIYFLDGWETGYSGSLAELNWLFTRWGVKFEDFTKINLDNHLTDINQ